MNLHQIIARLQEHEAELHNRGVEHAALFGFRARGIKILKATPTS
jgi:hypothetical protein